jgi:hypothetical protein
MKLSPLTDETKRLLDALPNQRDLYEPGGLFVGKGHRPHVPLGAHFAHLTSEVRPFLKRKMG